MASIGKTYNVTLLSLQSIASNSVVIGSAVDVSTKLAATATIHFGRRSNTALTAAAIFRIEASAKSSGDGFWWPLVQFSTAIAAVTSQAASGTINSGQNVIAMASTTGMSADPTSTTGHVVYIDNGTIANSEFHRVKLVTTNTSITLEDNLTAAQTGSTVYPAAEMYLAQLDLTAVARVRIVANGWSTGQAIAAEAFLVTGDTIA